MQPPPSRIPKLLLGAAVVASAALLLAFGAQMTFFQDSWAFLLERQGTSVDDFLRPHNEHISVVPVAIQKLLVGVFGMTSDWPEKILLTAMLAATAVLVFIYLQRRVGDWAALIGAVILLFLGSAWEVLLWPFEISLVGSVLAGVGALLMLDRNDSRGDLAACLLLTLAIAFSTLGLPFAVGAVVDVALRRDRGLLRRAYVPLVPLALYLLWYVAYGRENRTPLSTDSIINSPETIVEGFGASAAAALGPRLFEADVHSSPRPLLGLLLLALFGLYLLIWQRRALWEALRRGASTGLWTVLAAGACFWFFAAIGGRLPTTDRYMHAGVVFLLLALGNLLVGVRIGRRALLAAAAVAALAIGANVVQLDEGRDYLNEQSAITKADLAAIEALRGHIDPLFRLGPDYSGTPSLINVSAGPYFRQIDSHGSPAYTPEELAEAPAAARHSADLVMSRALPVATAVEPAPYYSGWKCPRLRPGEPLPMPPGSATVTPARGTGATVGLRRFGSPREWIRARKIPPGKEEWITILPDRLDRPWLLEAESSRPVRVCR